MQAFDLLRYSLCCSRSSANIIEQEKLVTDLTSNMSEGFQDYLNT